ncbi:hypothetical protein EJC49_23975 [Aquibium carbonis]|uniref:L-fucose isomerase C-terminal domain-containing protein n=1 Tax=Aquibium carbonis TaxID=2495581 RepID=A0A429YJE1_9HYPH|nr:hypothetical protein [Aquibium carbonis]RST81530.1 hypothetical protein EJC49_23975 [Aquibium carbonis]
MPVKGSATIGRVGLLPLGRPTFDVPYAEEKLAAMLAALDRTGIETAGSRSLLFDADATRAAIGALKGAGIDRLLVLQVTFTDAGMVAEAANAFDRPLAIWSVPEPRTGGRLRLNAFCGLNLAAHALGLSGRDFGHLHAAPDAPGIEATLAELLSGQRQAMPVEARAAIGDDADGIAAAEAIRGARIARIGKHPDGFPTCAYDKASIAALAGATVDELDLAELFDRAGAVSAEALRETRAAADAALAGLDDVDQAQLDRSLRLKPAIAALRAEGKYDAFAIRCWPETFTEYGGAVCGPVSMMGEARVPCACEADVYGALTTLLLQKVADAPAFLTDLVDLDADDDTGVVWHCGQAPISMADPDAVARATIHTNRKMPLLFEFPLKPGRVTFFRIRQARGRPTAVIGGGEVLKRPMAFTGTSGVVRFDTPAKILLDRIMGAALEHHMALAYGDHRNALDAAARSLGLPVLDL